MRVLHLTAALSLNSGYFTSSALVGCLKESGHSVLLRHYFDENKGDVIAKYPQMADDILDGDEFADFEPDVITFESGIMLGPDSDQWRLPESILVKFVDDGGVVLALDVGRGALTGTISMRRDLPFFGATIPDDDFPRYLEDSTTFNEHPARMVVHPDNMWVDPPLVKAFDGVESVQVWGGVPLEPVGEVAASSEDTARMFHLDVAVDGFVPAPFATVRNHRLGYAGVITGVVAADRVSIGHPDNTRWIRQLVELLHERTRQMRDMRHLTSTRAVRPRQSIPELIAVGESATVEFKQTARWNVRAQRPDKKMEKVVVKTVCGFLNADGGSLLIGVDDEGRVVGLEPDMTTLSKPNRDGYELALRQLLDNQLTESTAGLVEIRFETVDSKDVCDVSVRSADRPVFVRPRDSDRSRREFFVRVGNQTKELHGNDMLKYMRRHWEESSQ